MGRKDYQADLQAARDKSTHLPDGIQDLRLGDDDGSFAFLYAAPDLAPIAFTALIPELADYPREHVYMLYTTSDNVPPRVEKAYSNANFSGRRVMPMLSSLAALLQEEHKSNHGGGDDDEHDEGDVSDDLLEDGMEDPNDTDEDQTFQFDDGEFSQVSTAQVALNKSTKIRSSHEIKALHQRISSDLLLVKKAGFRIARVGDLISENSYLMISIRVARLKIQEDALRAWDLHPEEYLTLIIRYKDGYVPVEDIGSSISEKDLVLKVVLSKKFKISLPDAVTLCSDSDTTTKTSQETRELFIGPPLNEFLRSRLAAIIKYRLAMNLGWSGAEEYYNDHQSIQASAQAIDKKYYRTEKTVGAEHLPTLVHADHLSEQSQPHSFPLLAIQFTLRHLVRCTEFCLVCFCHIESDIEAIKPYVCSKPLCLYQYMALGFGPSIEHEIMTQPHVVDLLISFCFASASSRSLRSTPKGMGLIVPASMAGFTRAHTAHVHHGGSVSRMTANTRPQQIKSIDKPLPPLPADFKTVDYDHFKNELMFDGDAKDSSLAVGRWVEIWEANQESRHCRVLEIFYPHVRLSSAIEAFQPTSQMEHRFQNEPPTEKRIGQMSESSTKLVSVQYRVWDCHFDDIEQDDHQQDVISGLLRLLPSVTEMVSYLSEMPEKSWSLRKWVDRIPPASLGLLRWIIASNRSCIVQVDDIRNKSSTEDRVSGMEGYMQFRFATGAPDKEQRFLDAVKQQTHAKNLKHPTLFAWHGSALGNWHGIVREGLNFDRTANGRAYGDGVYHSLDANVSQGYSTSYTYGSSGPVWGQSELGVVSALCLNEIVNVPSEFVCKQPHLVVAQLDWIQTRYLFVKCGKLKEALPEAAVPQDQLRQDPVMRAKASNGVQIGIPACAINKARRAARFSSSDGMKRAMLTKSADETVVYISDESDAEDQALYEMHDLKLGGGGSGDPTKTSFEPGKLDQSSLPLLSAPSYATPNASITLQRELRKMLKVHESQPQHELGWYIAPEAVTNVYQWIFELHSFDRQLPLAQDMEKHRIQSIVLELRFGKDFPYSPPFVRVIRPRFLPFLEGGGGHVTSGGALCMELLTNSGWTAVNTIEAVLWQVRAAITSLEPKPARLVANTDYSAWEAREAYIRACKAHGWEIPKDFDETTSTQQ